MSTNIGGQRFPQQLARITPESDVLLRHWSVHDYMNAGQPITLFLSSQDRNWTTHLPLYKHLRLDKNDI